MADKDKSAMMTARKKSRSRVLAATRDPSTARTEPTQVGSGAPGPRRFVADTLRGPEPGTADVVTLKRRRSR